MKENPHKITEMPDKETLQAFLDGFHGGVRVAFNIEKGKFEWIAPKPVPKQAKHNEIKLHHPVIQR